MKEFQKIRRSPKHLCFEKVRALEFHSKLIEIRVKVSLPITINNQKMNIWDIIKQWHQTNCIWFQNSSTQIQTRLSFGACATFHKLKSVCPRSKCLILQLLQILLNGGQIHQEEVISVHCTVYISPHQSMYATENLKQPIISLIGFCWQAWVCRCQLKIWLSW